MSGPHDDGLAYGDDHGHGQGEGESDRGLLGDVYHRFQKFGVNEGSQNTTGGTQQQTGDSSLFDKLHSKVHQFGTDIKNQIAGQGEVHSHTHESGNCSVGAHMQHVNHRFHSFAPQRGGNQVKWYVDGCGYMWAVSEALERAQQSVWILDWWLSPELYLRRPPSRNENWRLDRVLHRAAQRGVKINIIVYKEVTQALTLSSAHTKHHLEELHPNIFVFRHPDHLPDPQSFHSSFMQSVQNFKMTAANAAKLPSDALKALYGVAGDNILYWAHHEKLCLIDGQTAFMGGLDLCYGRWDTNQHPIADVHPSDLTRILFPGQDFNNARIMDFQDVPNWEKNKLDRTLNSRMGWSDMSICLSGPTVEDLKTHFAERWNYIFNGKYYAKTDENRRYNLLPVPTFEGFKDTMQHPHPHNLRQEFESVQERFKDRVEQGFERGQQYYGGEQGQAPGYGQGYMQCQIMRSCCKWSHGVPLEHSIASAYIDVIRNSQHFVYIENQFFITGTSDRQRPIRNKIGAALVERILRAARAGQKYHVIIVIPALPAFAGDLRDDDSLACRAIIEFQYNSINRGDDSIMQRIAREGFDPMQYIRFYNLRNYDRINANATMHEVEQQSGVPYEQAHAQHDNLYAASIQPQTSAYQQYNSYQGQADPKQRESDKWDSVSSCYMFNGQDIRSVPWDAGEKTNEVEAFVSEELYVHSKLLIADDRVVICGSANLNDRSQLGEHDSEIAILVEDNDLIDIQMNGAPWQASRFAASLRRQIFRKHLGLLQPQDCEAPDENFQPIGVPNAYDWGSEPDMLVADPLAEDFYNLWTWTARNNTEAFEKVFHPVPSDKVQSWQDYDQYHGRFFHQDKKEGAPPSKYRWGHVVAEEFAQGPEGIRELKDTLSKIKGTLVEMPLLFLKNEDIAKEGLSLNAFTEEVYT